VARRIRAMRTVGRLIAEGVLASEPGRVFEPGDYLAALAEAERPGRGGKEAGEELQKQKGGHGGKCIPAILATCVKKREGTKET